MNLITQDPLALVAIQSGNITPPKNEAAAAGGNKLDTAQRSIEIGEPVPLVFARRRSDAGGVLISPGASECRFENNTNNDVTAYYHLVLSEGLIESIPVKDVFQRSCRVGSHSQTYDRRAGTWTPGNTIVNRNRPYRRFFTTETFILDSQSKIDKYNAILTATLIDPAELDNYPYNLVGDWDEATLTDPTAPEKNSSWNYNTGSGRTLVKDIKATNFTTPEASFYCGSVGTYDGLSTLSFSITIPNGFDQWNRQVHCFIRGGIKVTRLYDNTYGSSDNFADLVQWLLINSCRLPTSLIDTDALLKAAQFLEANGLRCNCWITKSSNFTDLLAQWAPYFLLCESNVSGKRGLRPLLPTTSTGAIDTAPVVPVYNFTEDNILPGTLEIEYTSLTQRNPFVAQVIWRQQLEDDFGIIRTAEVSYAGTSDAGPFESHDLSEFCTTESHAVKVGAYLLAKRRYVQHLIRFTAKPGASNVIVKGGDIIRVKLQRQTSNTGAQFHDFLYQVERVGKTLSGELSYECTHFPIDEQGRSKVAMEVVSAQPTGIVLTSTRTGVSCDVNSSTNNTIPAETFTNGTGYPGVTLPGGGSTGTPSGDTTNPDDGLDGTGNVPIVQPVFRGPTGDITTTPTADDRIEPYNPCGNGSEPLQAVYVNGQPVSSPVASPTELQVIGTMTMQWNSTTQMQVYYYCRDANGQPRLTAKSQTTTIQAAPNGTPTQVYAAILVIQTNPSYSDYGQTTLFSYRWLQYPPTQEGLQGSAFSWGGANFRVAIGYKPGGFRYSNGVTIYSDSATVMV